MSTKVLREGADRVYRAAQAWVDAALRSDSSLFTPGEPIWSSRWLRELRERFLDQPDESKMKFLEKLRGQLDDGTPEVHQLMAEALYLHLLIVSTRNGNNKRRTIDTVLNWSSSPVVIQEDLVAALAPGIANPGQYFHVKRPNQVGFLIEFVEQWKELGADEQTRLLADQWAFKDFVLGLEFNSVLLTGEPNSYRTQREALLHLVFPDAFEAIVSSNHKHWIAGAFAKFVEEPAEDVDRRVGADPPGDRGPIWQQRPFLLPTGSPGSLGRQVFGGPLGQVRRTGARILRHRTTGDGGDQIQTRNKRQTGRRARCGDG